MQVLTVLEVDGTPTEVDAPQRVLPDGIVEIVVHFGAPFAMRHAGGAFAAQPRSFAISQTHRFVEFRPIAGGGFVSARLHPWAAPHLFGTPVSDFADRLVPGEELWGAKARRLEEALALGGDAADRARRLCRFLRSRLRAEGEGALRGAVRAIRRRRGDVSIRHLCAELGVGERRLERAFRHGLGTSPKHFALVTRFLCACRTLRAGEWATLAEAAHACGYADQAHFNRDVRALSGLTPRELLGDDRVAFLQW